VTIKIRRLGGDDASVFVEHRELLDDQHAILLVAFDDEEEVGFVLAHAANRLYERVGGTRSDVAMWDFEFGEERKS
jgi:hypothetical protein